MQTPRSYRNWLALTLALVVSLHAAYLCLAAKPGGGNPPPPPPLPPVRYVLSFPAMPEDATGLNRIFASNSAGEVVGYYARGEVNVTAGFLYDGSDVFNLNDIAVGGIPEGWYIRACTDINDHGVVVGVLATDGTPSDRRAFALDLRTENPVVDLLPDFGAAYSVAAQINEYGQILGYYETPTGDLEYYFFDPGLYAGDPDISAARDGTPIDMSGDAAELLPLTNADTAGYIFLNNPVGDRPAQVAGNFDGVAFRYTIGDDAPETFPGITLTLAGLSGIDDAGMFYGVARFTAPATKGKAKTYYAPFRYGAVLEQLPSPPYIPYVPGVNSSGDLLISSNTYVDRAIYRDDWYGDYGIVDVDNLVVGAGADLLLWAAGRASVVELSDRSGPANAGLIVGNLYDINPDGIFFVLKPVPVEP